MIPKKFKESNVVYGKNQKEYLPLPALSQNNKVITCWHLSLWERLKLLFTGKIWLCILTFNEQLQPLFLTTVKNEIIKRGEK